ncbi:putative gamma-butyrobetaine dioxygenase [Frankliniella fusca]|uniref:Gamma-butyrobetaine dioxygenase n=1 Tax=Frankliniella fusca TaxID=407009 RepID=A0AAE1L7F4_9NEOP|nr:putative gamma-butyrobetaine dioxygenase [Frankliniella fusca]
MTSLALGWLCREPLSLGVPIAGVRIVPATDCAQPVLKGVFDRRPNISFEADLYGIKVGKKIKVANKGGYWFSTVLHIFKVYLFRSIRGVIRACGIVTFSSVSVGGFSLLRLSGTLFCSLRTNSKSKLKLLRKLMNLSKGLFGASIDKPQTFFVECRPSKFTSFYRSTEVCYRFVDVIRFLSEESTQRMLRCIAVQLRWSILME